MYKICQFSEHLSFSAGKWTRYPVFLCFAEFMITETEGSFAGLNSDGYEDLGNGI